MSTPDEAIVLGPGEGKAVQAMGNQLSYKAVGEDTDSRYALVEFAVAPGFGGTPPHIHHSSEEAIYVLQGEMQVRVGDRTIPASAGSFVLVPRGVVHTLSNPSTTPARVLSIFSPAGFEKYFEEIAALSAAGRSPDLATIVALGKKYDSELVGQPEVQAAMSAPSDAFFDARTETFSADQRAAYQAGWLGELVAHAQILKTGPFG